jgi:hypothetical protein
MADSFTDKVRRLLASDVYSEKGRLRSDDLLVRERISRGLGEGAARIRDLISGWRADRVPASTREQPFPPAEVMEPIRKAERLLRAIEDTSASIRGLPLLPQDRVWDRVRHLGLEELMQFDWTLVGEADELCHQLTTALALDQVDVAAQEARLRKIREVVGDRQRYLEIQA